MLEQLGLNVEVVPPPAGAEPCWSGEPPQAFAREAARTKARAVAEQRTDAIVVAADTIVVLDGDVLGKPADPAEARRMLSRLAGREHLVHTGVAIVTPEAREGSGVETTAVAIRPLERGEIEAYVATGEPLDKAGAYGIQGLGAALVESVRGCYYNVMGLPIARFLAVLQELDYGYVWPGRIEPGAPS